MEDTFKEAGVDIPEEIKNKLKCKPIFELKIGRFCFARKRDFFLYFARRLLTADKSL